LYNEAFIHKLINGPGNFVITAFTLEGEFLRKYMATDNDSQDVITADAEFNLGFVPISYSMCADATAVMDSVYKINIYCHNCGWNNSIDYATTIVSSVLETHTGVVYDSMVINFLSSIGLKMVVFNSVPATPDNVQIFNEIIVEKNTFEDETVNSYRKISHKMETNGASNYIIVHDTFYYVS
jgi:hypothetical protein